MKIRRRFHIGGKAMIQWALQFSQNIIFHGLKIQDSCAANIQGGYAGLVHLFTLSCGVPVVFGPTRNEFGDDVTIEFIHHIPEKTICGDGRLIGTPFVDHAVRVIVKDLPLEDIKGLIEFEPSVTGGEGRRKDIGFGAFDRIIMYTGVDSLQDVVAEQEC